MTKIAYHKGIPRYRAVALKRRPRGHECPYCLAPTGYIVRLLADLLGAQFHGCTFSNVMHPQQLAHLEEVWDRLGETG